MNVYSPNEYNTEHILTTSGKSATLVSKDNGRHFWKERQGRKLSQIEFYSGTFSINVQQLKQKMLVNKDKKYKF